MTVKELIKNKPDVLKMKLKGDKAMKAAPHSALQTKAEGEGSLEIEAIGNLPMFIDSDMDCILPGAYTKTLAENKANIKFLRDHRHSFEGLIGTMEDVWLKFVNASDLMDGLPERAVQALAFKGIVKREYDEKMFQLYQQGQVKEHSIGFKYLQVGVAINDPSDEEGYKIWQETYKNLLNPWVADEKGYFYVIKELKLYEISAVLWGANPATPVLGASSEPQKSTQKTLFEHLTSL